MRDKFAQLLFFILSPLLVFTILTVLPHAQPLISPSDAFLSKNPSIQIESYIGNSKVDLQWSLNLDRPKSFFRGVKSISLYGENEDYLVYLHLPLENTLSSQIDTEIYLRKDEGGAFVPEFPQNNPLILNVDKYNQRLKNFSLKTTISMPRISLTHKKESWHKKNYSPVTLEIKNGRIDVESEVIYEWSNKGGDTYRL